MSSSGRGRAGKAPERGHVPPGRRFAASLAEQNLYIATPEEESRWSRGDDPRVPELTTQRGSTSLRQSRTSSSLNREAANESASSDQRFICSICFKRYSRNHDLNRHIDAVHARETKCVGCGEIVGAANVGDHQCNHAAGESANRDNKNEVSKGSSSGPKGR